MNENIKDLLRYLSVGYLDNNPYKEIITELIKYDKPSFISSQKRDSCGYIAIVLEDFAKDRGVVLKRVEGVFHTDVIHLKKLDFFKEELLIMSQEGLNPQLKEDRLQFVINNQLEERQKQIPHYWNEDNKGNIVDLSGYCQFVKSGFSKDLNKHRYIANNLKNKMRIK